MAGIKSESVADFIPESVADFVRNQQLSIWPEFEWERLVLDPEPDYLRQISRAPQANAAQIRKNAGEFQSAV